MRQPRDVRFDAEVVAAKGVERSREAREAAFYGAALAIGVAQGKPLHVCDDLVNLEHSVIHGQRVRARSRVVPEDAGARRSR